MPNPSVRAADQPLNRGGNPSRSASLDTPGHRWTFFTNHAHVLILLHSNPGLVLREVAGRVGITERAVQRIVHELEEAGFLERERVGRRNHYRVLADKHLRHAVESHCKVEDVLRLVVGERRSQV